MISGGEPEITPRLATLAKWVTKIHQAGLQACHCTEEFTLRWICPLGHQEKLAYECSLLVDLTRKLAEGKIINYLVVDV
jgi:hypothetical protein